MWKWNGAQWMWVTGPTSINNNGNFGQQGVPTTNTNPPSRAGAVGWVSSDNSYFWLFGGERDCTSLHLIASALILLIQLITIA